MLTNSFDGLGYRLMFSFCAAPSRVNTGGFTVTLTVGLIKESADEKPQRDLDWALITA
ncbi:hypothetical protein MYP_4615 [Sporocytophaga myxococcoides]|uniref:Uncharacterized protein n=1 Tax=Sporocytophaga myxococcoides TaxID=153721 RepID=A0A098LK94_9BACT|nr:hypothetical protein MYP_4615 [Sporocytophaga myxococcoides]